MSTAPQQHAVEIVTASLAVLRAHGIEISDALILERARNLVVALEGSFELVPHRLDLVEVLREATRQFRAAARDVKVMLRAEVRR